MTRRLLGGQVSLPDQPDTLRCLAAREAGLSPFDVSRRHISRASGGPEPEFDKGTQLAAHALVERGSMKKLLELEIDTGFEPVFSP